MKIFVFFLVVEEYLLFFMIFLKGYGYYIDFLIVYVLYVFSLFDVSIRYVNYGIKFDFEFGDRGYFLNVFGVL